eukprot:s430_g9.t1
MALTVANDLQTPIEVKLQEEEEEWKIVYPGRSCEVGVSDGGVTLVFVRLIESLEVWGSCQVEAGAGSTLRASLDFEAFSRQAKGRDRSEARELAREGKNGGDDPAGHQQETERRRLADCPRNSIPPESAVAAVLLASATVPLCCCLCILTVSFGAGEEGKDEFNDFKFGKYVAYVRVGLKLAGILALMTLAVLTVQHALSGFWWTAAIVWPVPLGAGVCLGVVLLMFSRRDLDHDQKKQQERQHREAHGELRNRSIRFEGSVIRERGRPCVASWPGKYEGAWESLVSQGRNGQVSAAVVFLPQGTRDYGKHESIPKREDLPGTCWCVPLYGEQKAWGCRWFTKWRENIEKAVQSGAELEVYYFQNHVGKGKVESFESAGKENLQREKVNKKQEEFEASPQFKQMLDAGLGNLSQEPRGDGSSQYSREARRVFLASLSEAERKFLAASEGLGNSQKAEVAWLEKKATSTGRLTSPRGSLEKDLSDTSRSQPLSDRMTSLQLARLRFLEQRDVDELLAALVPQLGRLRKSDTARLLFALALSGATSPPEIFGVLAAQYAADPEVLDPKDDIDVAWALCALELSEKYRNVLERILQRCSEAPPQSTVALIKLHDVLASESTANAQLCEAAAAAARAEATLEGTLQAAVGPFLVDFFLERSSLVIDLDLVSWPISRRVRHRLLRKLGYRTVLVSPWDLKNLRTDADLLGFPPADMYGAPCCVSEPQDQVPQAAVDTRSQDALAQQCAEQAAELQQWQQHCEEQAAQVQDLKQQVAKTTAKLEEQSALLKAKDIEIQQCRKDMEAKTVFNFAADSPELRLRWTEDCQPLPGVPGSAKGARQLKQSLAGRTQGPAELCVGPPPADWRVLLQLRLRAHAEPAGPWEPALLRLSVPEVEVSSYLGLLWPVI